MYDGRCPWIWLSAISNSINEERLDIEGGIVPENLFPGTLNNVSLVN